MKIIIIGSCLFLISTNIFAHGIYFSGGLVSILGSLTFAGIFFVVIMVLYGAYTVVKNYVKDIWK